MLLSFNSLASFFLFVFIITEVVPTPIIEIKAIHIIISINVKAFFLIYKKSD